MESTETHLLPRNPVPLSRSKLLVQGRLLAGRYRIGELLGRGGLGEVYQAEDLVLGESVALKFLSADPEKTTDRAEMLLNELRLARRVSHINVCRLHDVGEAAGHYFLSMELIDGETLASLLHRQGRPSPTTAHNLARELCAALDAVHRQGILHRDLKPGNLMLDSFGRIRLMDFGLAGWTDAKVQGGTPAYMAPELHTGSSASVASDIYALGLVLYELFTGVRTFKAPTPVELVWLHLEASPKMPSSIVEELHPALERLILKCLEKKPRHRPVSVDEVSQALVAVENEPASLAGETLHSLTLSDTRGTLHTAESLAVQNEVLPRSWPAPSPPRRPYPLLLPYEHPALLTGRDRELVQMRRLLSLPVPILGLHAASGVGKSSLLTGGLVPLLRSAGRPVALDRHPHEPGLADRLLGDLLNESSPLPTSEAELAKEFIHRLERLEEVTGRPALLVLDQFEDLLRRAPRRIRARIGMLLAASVRRQPGRSTPPCRWLLAYRQDYHGGVVAWLGDILLDVEAEGFEGLDALPRNLGTAERFHGWPLRPLGTPPPGTEDDSQVARVFLQAIQQPLAWQDEEGNPRFPWRFRDEDAARLAEAFAKARQDRPEAPLTPELQVVLAHLMAQGRTADDEGVVQLTVPEDCDALLDRALEEHLRRSLDFVFPNTRGGRQELRSRALLALCELAEAGGAKGGAIPASRLVRALGAGGDEILEKLASPRARLVVPLERPEGLCFALSHDQLATVVVRAVGGEGRLGSWEVDEELLALRRLVTLNSALHSSQARSLTRLPKEQFRRIEEHEEALIWGRERQQWWSECQAQWRRDRRRSRWLSVGLVALLLLVALGAWLLAGERAAREALLEEVARGEPPAALDAIIRLMGEGMDAESLRERLVERQHPLDLLERGLEGVDTSRRNAVVLDLVELGLPLVHEDTTGFRKLATVLWALDFFPSRDPALAEHARDLRRRALEPLLQQFPPPEFNEEEWAFIPAGQFLMGSGESEMNPDWDQSAELPEHPVQLAAFRLLRHEVTAQELRRLIPDYPGAAALPAIHVSWYNAYTYAAWLGGRLPSEAEWEYAAWAGCPHAFCDREGREAPRDQVCWYRNTAVDPETFEISRRPGMELEPNLWGLFDMCGNVWEWTADWFGPYGAAGGDNPPGPVSGNMRVMRGGSYFDNSYMARREHRLIRSPELQFMNMGFRVWLPAPQNGS